MARILAIEDEADLREVLAYNLSQAGHETLVAATGTEGLALARSHLPDLVLLDLMLPDVSGRQVCAELKRGATTREIPIIMLTARGDEVDRVVGFELGAEDYVVKPFSVRELLLRIQAVVRRAQGVAPPLERTATFGCLAIDREAHRAWIQGAALELTALEFKLLTLLYDRRGRVQTRSALLEEVWGIQAPIATRTVDTHVKRLREKLGAARDYIETVRGVGYRFVESPNGANR